MYKIKVTRDKPSEEFMSLAIDRHLRKLKQLKRDLELIEIKREHELRQLETLVKCLKQCRISRQMDH